jgi:hypothetical protein
MPAAYTGVEMPRDLLVRDDAELAKIAMEEQMAEDDDSELSELDDEMFVGPGMWFLHARRLTQEEREQAKGQKAHETEDEDEDKDTDNDEDKDDDEEENEETTRRRRTERRVRNDGTGVLSCSCSFIFSLPF